MEYKKVPSYDCYIVYEAPNCRYSYCIAPGSELHKRQKDGMVTSYGEAASYFLDNMP